MRRLSLVALLLAGLFVATTACSPDVGDGDGDADGDVDGDSDGDGDADADGDGGCPADWDCCEDSECSDQIYCNGLERCDRGVCEPTVPIDCDDGLDCTEDACNEASNVCVHEPVHDECSDGDTCNGDERCDPRDAEADARGCIFGQPMNCDDGDPCTQDYCEDNECLWGIRDSDGDGWGDEDCTVCFDPTDPDSCETGEDCNDINPDTYPGAVEICDDGDDNNCDRIRDYADPLCIVPNDSCATAIGLTADTVVHSSTRATLADIDTACGSATDRDVAFYFNTTAVHDVEIHVTSGGSGVSVALTPSCGDAAADRRCTSGRTVTQMNRGLPAGTYFVVVSASSEVDLDIYYTITDPVPRPDGDQCATATDVSGGGVFTGTTTGFDPDYESRCGDVADLDRVYSFTLTEPRSMDLEVTATTGPIAVSIQEICGVMSSERGCFEAAPTDSRHYRNLDPGTYYLIIKTPGADDYEFDLSFGPTEPGVDLNFIAMPWDFFAWDAAVASVIYRAVTYDFGFDPTVACILDGADTDGEFLQTKAALTSVGFPATNLVDIADSTAAAAAMGTYDVILFNEFEAGTPSALAWEPVLIDHLAGGGRVLITYGGSRNATFINDLGLFGSGSSGSGSTPYTVEPHPFWDGTTTMPTSSFSATSSWTWSGPYLVPLARRSATEYMVWGYNVP